MPAYQDPATLRRRLQRDLRNFRSQAGMTQRDVADAMDWSPSKLIRIESGAVAVSTNDLRALLAHYGITDAEAVEELVTAAKRSKKSSWAEYRDVISPQAATFFGYEADASVIRQFVALIVPGLLQTEEYMRSIFEHALTGKKDIERLVQARLERQEILDREAPPEMFFILDQAVVSRVVGGPKIMRRQLEQLEELGSRPNISIQIVPFDRGSYQGMLGSFTLLEFPSDDTLMYLESRIDTVTRDDPEETGRLLDAFWHIERNLASPAADLPGVLAKIKTTTGLEA